MKAAYQFMKKFGVTIGFSLGAFLSVLVILIIISGFPEGATLEELYKSSIFNPAINISFGLIVIAFFAAIVGPTIYTVLNFKDSVKFLIALAAMVILYLISRAMGSVPNQQELVFFQGVDNQHLIASDVAFVDGLLLFTGIMIFLTLASLVFMGVWGLLKQR